jgi:alpha-beta hydrolase superfamily lysophospholipase
MSPAQKLLLAATSRVAPRLSLGNGLEVGAISHDAAVVAAYRADPLNHGKVTPGLVQFMLDAIVAVQRRASTLSVPVLMLVAGADRLVVPTGSLAFFDSLPAGIGTMRWYDDAYHEVFNETTERRARALADLTVWIDSQLTPSS